MVDVTDGRTARTPADASARWRPEHDLLVACAGTWDARERARRMAEAIARGIDWSLLVDLARAHSVLPLVHWRIEATGTDSVPAQIARQLADTFRSSAWRTVFLMGETLRVVRTLADNGVPSMPFKGGVLAATVYDNAALRPFSDIDLLIRPSDRRRVMEVLHSIGFAPFADWTQVDELNHEYVLIANGDRVRVDVHSDVFPRSVLPIDSGGLWERARSVRIGEQDVLTFSVEDTLLILCVHADTHMWERLLWLGDIAGMVAAHATLDWGRLLRLARQSGSERILFLGLRLATDLLGAVLPADVERAVWGNAAVARLAAEVVARLTRDPSRDPVSADLAKSLFQLRSRPRFRDKIRLAATPNETDWAVVRLPRALYPLYYVLRPVRLLIKYGAGRIAKSSPQGTTGGRPI